MKFYNILQKSLNKSKIFSKIKEMLTKKEVIAYKK